MTTPYSSRFEKFLLAHRIEPRDWYVAAGMSRAAFRAVRRGSDPYLSTARRLVISGTALLRRQVRTQELWDVGELEPVPAREDTPPRPRRSSRQAESLKQYNTPLDRILRAENLYPSFFGREAGLTPQTLQRLRSAETEPCMSTVAQIVRTLRRLTGIPYRAQDVFELGEPR